MDKARQFSFLIAFILLIVSVVSFQFRPTPWLTEGAVEFLTNFIEKNPNAKILEFGAGASTIWFTQKSVCLVSIEHDPVYYELVNQAIQRINDNNSTLLQLVPRPYYTICDGYPDNSFDLILIDGRDRSRCLLQSKRLVKLGGIIMLDNAERSWYQKAMSTLSTWNHIISIQCQKDSCGFTYPNWQTHWWVKPISNN